MSDLMRKEFEAACEFRFNWALQDPYRDESERTLSTWDGETYRNRIVQGMWWAWQASRECLVIELPKPYAVIGDYADCGGGRTVWDAEFSEKITDRMCKKTAVYDKTIFEALGLKVKP